MPRKRPEAPSDLFDLPLEPPGATDATAGAGEVEESDEDAPAGAPETAETEVEQSEEPVGTDLADEDSGEVVPIDEDPGDNPDDLDDWLEGVVEETPEPAQRERSQPENLTLFEGETGAGDGVDGGVGIDSVPLAGAGSGAPEQAVGTQLGLDDAADSAASDIDVDEASDQPPGLGLRVMAGAADCLVHVASLAVALLAMVWRGLQPGLEQWPGLLLFLLAFSFLYWTFPLAFWGQTPGMAWTGLKARDFGNQPLTFGQTALRWLGAWLTVALAGLPLLVALSGRSLSDRLSRSHTLLFEAGEDEDGEIDDETT